MSFHSRSAQLALELKLLLRQQPSLIVGSLRRISEQTLSALSEKRKDEEILTYARDSSFHARDSFFHDLHDVVSFMLFHGKRRRDS